MESEFYWFIKLKLSGEEGNQNQWKQQKKIQLNPKQSLLSQKIQTEKKKSAWRFLVKFQG